MVHRVERIFVARQIAGAQAPWQGANLGFGKLGSARRHQASVGAAGGSRGSQSCVSVRICRWRRSSRPPHRLYSRQCAIPANGKQICDKDDRETFSSVQIPSLQDSSEFGPRALGNRSLLADPRKSEMRDILDKRVKHPKPSGRSRRSHRPNGRRRCSRARRRIRC